jgi:hypothetical protein
MSLKEILFNCKESYDTIMDAIMKEVYELVKNNLYPEIMNKEQAMDRLGCKQTKLQELRENFEISIYKSGSNIYYPRESIEAYIKRNTIKGKYDE